MGARWRERWLAVVGGLTDVGFSSDDRFLLALSHSGRGLFECETGERVARDRRDDWTYFDDNSGAAAGIGPLDGRIVPVAGLMARRSLTHEHGNCHVSAVVGGVDIAESDGYHQLIEETEEIKTFGFSYSGAWLVIATSSSLTVFVRAHS